MLFRSRKKNLDLIVLNNILNADAGFSSDSNQVKIIKADQKIIDIPLMLKTDIAVKILDEVEKLI